MGDWPDNGIQTTVGPPGIHSQMGDYFATDEGRAVAVMNANGASTAWGAANLALYLPFSLRHPYTIRKLGWTNGSAAGGEWSAGIYTAEYLLLDATAAAAGSGNSIPQYAFLPEERQLTLPPGDYIYALLHSATSINQITALTITAIQGRLLGMTQQAVGSMTLPASATPATFAQTIYPACGFTNLAAGL